jgi:hypothetical protein
MGSVPVTSWKGERGYLLFVEDVPDDESAERRLVRLAVGRPEGMTLPEWLAEMQSLAREAGG